MLLQNIIPKPVEIKATGFAFQLTKETNIVLNDSTSDLLKLGQYLSNNLKPATGFPLLVVINKEHQVGNIFLSISALDSLTNKEGYELNISADSVSLEICTAVTNGIKSNEDLTLTSHFEQVIPVIRY